MNAKEKDAGTEYTASLSEEELARQLRREAAVFFPERNDRQAVSANRPPQTKEPSSLPRSEKPLGEGESDYERKTAPAHVRKDGVLREGESEYEGVSPGALGNESTSLAVNEIGDEAGESRAGRSGPLQRENLVRGFKLAAVLGKPRGLKAWGEDEF